MFDRIKCFLYQAGFIFLFPLRVVKTYNVLSITAWMIREAAAFATSSSVAIARIFSSPFKEAHLRIVSSARKV